MSFGICLYLLQEKAGVVRRFQTGQTMLRMDYDYPFNSLLSAISPNDMSPYCLVGSRLPHVFSWHIPLLDLCPCHFDLAISPISFSKGSNVESSICNRHQRLQSYVLCDIYDHRTSSSCLQSRDYGDVL